MTSIIQFVEGKLKLKVNREKSAVDRPWNCKFLGFSFLSNKQATIRLAPKTFSGFKEKIRELTSRIRSISMEERISRLNRYLMGWGGGLFLASLCKGPLSEIRPMDSQKTANVSVETMEAGKHPNP